MSETAKIGVGNEVYTLDVSPQFQTYSGVEIIVDEKTSYLAGNDINRILRIENPWGTQAQAEAILEALQAKAFQYQPFTASGASLNPAAEIGDGITVSDTYSGIYKMTRTFSPLATAEIEAPQDEEVDHEYPFESKQDRIYKREIADNKARISITQDQISAEVTRATNAESSLSSQITQTATEISANVVKKTGGDQSQFGWSLTDSAWSVYSDGLEVFRIDSSGATVKGTITATSGTIGGFTIGQTAIYNGMNDIGSAENGIFIGTSGISVGGGAFKVTASGSVSANNMTLTGTLTVGDNTISANTLRQGAKWASAGHTSWDTTTTDWTNATKSKPQSYPSYFTADYLYAITYLSAAALNVSGNASIGGNLKVGGNSLSRLELTVYTQNYGYQTKTFWVS